MKNKISFILKKMDKAICFQITEQSEFDNKYKLMINNYRIYIESKVRPDISYYNGKHTGCETLKEIRIYLRGKNTSKNLDLIQKNFRSNKERDIIYDIIIKSFESIKSDNLKYCYKKNIY